MSKISEKQLQKSFYESNHSRYEMLVPNVHLCWQFNEMDIFCLRPSGYVDEIEIKLSASDFKADFKKKVHVKDGKHLSGWDKHKQILKHDALQQGLNRCNYFSFLIPEELIDKCEIPDHAGLYVFKFNNAGRGIVTEVKRAKILHKRKISDTLKYRAARKASVKYWYSTGVFKDET